MHLLLAFTMTSFFFSFLFYNVDVSTTMIVRPGPVVDFLIANQSVKDPSQIDWNKVTYIVIMDNACGVSL